MRPWLAVLTLILTPALASAQFELLIGKRVRAKLGGPDGPWVQGFVMETNSDSLTMKLADERTVVRLSTADVSVQRSDGHNTGSGVLRGALIGAIATVAIFASIPEARESEVALLLYFGYAPVGAALGGAVGFATASERWTPVSSGTRACGGWRTLVGQTGDAPIVFKGPRNRRRGAIIWGSVLGGIGLVGGLTDPKMPSGDVPGIVVGNALIGALVGSFFGPRESVALPVSCPSP